MQTKILLALILILAAILRCIFISANEAHFDEIWHLEFSTGRGGMHDRLPLNVFIPRLEDATSLDAAPSWRAIFFNLDDDAHPPLHYLLLRGWRAVFGQSLTVARLMSAAISVLCVLLLFDAARQIHPTNVALWAALILALSSAQIEAAQEVRGYPLLVLLSLCSADALLRIEKNGANAARLIALCLAIAGMLLTHYFAVSVLAALVMYSLIRLRGEARRTAFIGIFAAVIFFAAIWGRMMLRQSHALSTTSDSYLDDSPRHYLEVLRNLCTVPLRQLFDPRRAAFVSCFSGVIFLLPWLMLRKRPELLLWSIWLIVTVGFVAAIDLARSTQLLGAVRQTLLAGPALCVILAAMMTGQRKLLAHGVPALVAIACAASLGLTYNRPNVRFSQIGKYLQGAQNTDEPIIFADTTNAWWARWLYLAAAHYSQVFPRSGAILTRPADPKLLAELHRWPTLWLVWDGTDLDSHPILPGAQAYWIRFEPNVGAVAHVRWNGPETATTQP